MASQQRHQDTRVFLMPMEGLECAQNISFLFSQTQVVEILGNRPIQKIPFSPRHLLGIIAYQGRLLPVISLPDLCGRASEVGRIRYKQLMVVRTGVSDPDSGEPLKVALATNAAIRILKLSSQALVNSFIQKQAPDWLTASIGLRGFFQWQDECVALMQLNNVSLGNDAPSPEGIGRE
ncbi:MAG: chemotaxis protein CheW [Desulfobulbus sp.]|nr:chemotaxis protein CheW [Desulfobulbus sp.]